MKKSPYLSHAIPNTLLTIVMSLLCAFSLPAIAQKDASSPTVQSKDSIISPRIVGGEVATPQDWPWMTAYVRTVQGVETSLIVNNIIYNTAHFTSGPTGQVTAVIASCGDGQQVCENVQNKICLIERGINTFAEKALNCETAGGIGAIIYNNESGVISGTVGANYTGTIPLVAVTQADGEKLLELLDETAVINVLATSNLRQDASCGASFLGGKWVLIAAHCVNSANAFLYQMNVGEYDLSDGAENATPIANTYIHPDYDKNTFNNDIALVELTESINVPPIQLADTDITNQLAENKSTATVAGWGGRTGYINGEGPTSNYPDILHKVDLTLLTNEECQQHFSNVTITDAMLCATSTLEKGSCQGDSGGPLVVETNIGLQQVGIVSFGAGCADPNFPGVYTRVAKFTDWIANITEGIAIQQLQDFGIIPVGIPSTAELTITNYSDIPSQLRFSIQGAAEFSLGEHNCSNLAANSSCQLTVNYHPINVGEHTAKIIIDADSNLVKVTEGKLQGLAINHADGLTGVAGPANNKVSWFSGGNRAWNQHAIGGVESGNISHNQQSILLALIEGAGTLSFDWGVSSEKNEDDENNPFDILELYIDGQLIEFISGEVAIKSYANDSNRLTLGDGLHTVTWVYSKDKSDPPDLDVDDKAYVNNVTFVADPVTNPPEPEEPPTSSSSGGGSLTGLLLVLTALLGWRTSYINRHSEIV